MGILMSMCMSKFFLIIEADQGGGLGLQNTRQIIRTRITNQQKLV